MLCGSGIGRCRAFLRKSRLPSLKVRPFLPREDVMRPAHVSVSDGFLRALGGSCLVALIVAASSGCGGAGTTKATVVASAEKDGRGGEGTGGFSAVRAKDKDRAAWTERPAQ